MMIYATYEFYKTEYGAGESGLTSEQFTRHARKATAIIRERTFNRIGEDIPEEVSLCCCELVGHLQKCEERKEHSGITSERDGNWSASYETGEAQATEEAVETSRIINTWLMPTGLLYAGREWP